MKKNHELTQKILEQKPARNELNTILRFYNKKPVHEYEKHCGAYTTKPERVFNLSKTVINNNKELLEEFIVGYCDGKPLYKIEDLCLFMARRLIRTGSILKKPKLAKARKAFRI